MIHVSAHIVRSSSEAFTAEERGRLFDHAIHEEGVFYNRLNFFLVFESLLFAAAITGFSGDDAPPKPLIRVVCVVGLIVTAVWWYAQANKLVLLKALEDRIQLVFAEFRETILLANQRRIFQIWSSNAILTHGFPPIFVVAWCFMLHYNLPPQWFETAAETVLEWVSRLLAHPATP